MHDEICLFVYGLLMSGETGFRALDLGSRIRSLGTDRVAGRLYHLGDYPGYVPGPHGFVHGELMSFTDPALLDAIDAYELYDPENPQKSEYRRIEADLIDSGRRVWVYEYGRPITNRPIIATGNWRVL